MNYDVSELEEIWRKGDGEMPDKLKHVVKAAQDEMLLRAMQLSVDEENTVRYIASKNKKTVSEYVTALVLNNV